MPGIMENAGDTEVNKTGSMPLKSQRPVGKQPTREHLGCTSHRVRRALTKTPTGCSRASGRGPELGLCPRRQGLRESSRKSDVSSSGKTSDNDPGERGKIGKRGTRSTAHVRAPLYPAHSRCSVKGSLGCGAEPQARLPQSRWVTLDKSRPCPELTILR